MCLFDILFTEIQVICINLLIPYFLAEKSGKIFELRKGAKYPQCNSSFVNKIGGRSNAEFSNLEL